MVQFSLVTPLGIPVQEGDFDSSHRQLERAGGLKDVNRPEVRKVIDSLLRDARLQANGGRWTPGRPDPDQFVPGDIAAIRAVSSDSIVHRVGAISLERARTLHLRAMPSGDLDLVSDREGLLVQLDPDRLLEQPFAASLLVDLYGAVPYFIPTTAAALASRPPSYTLQQELRVPFERTLVLFGADLELDPDGFPWPEQFPYQELDRFGVVGELIARGGHLSGLVLLADDHGYLRDDVIWLVAANPRPHDPWPASLDRIRGLVRGYRSAATLAPLVTNVAAAVAWAVWRDPPPTPDLPSDPTARQLRKALKHNSVRVRERQGALVGVRTLDLARNSARAAPATTSTTNHAGSHPPGCGVTSTAPTSAWSSAASPNRPPGPYGSRPPRAVVWGARTQNPDRRPQDHHPPPPLGLQRATPRPPPCPTTIPSSRTCRRRPALGQRVRTIRAAIDDREEGWRRIQRGQRQQTLPIPAPTAVATAITIVEVRAGLRAPRQLEPVSHHSLWRFWPRLLDPPDDRAIPIAPHPLAVTVRELSPGLVDANVVVGFGGRTHALALRLDGAPGFWQLIELDYPTGWSPLEPPTDVDRSPTAPGPEGYPLQAGIARPSQSFPDPSQQLPPPALHPNRELHEDLGIEFE